MPGLAPMLKKAMPAIVNISTRSKIDRAEHALLRDPFRHFFEIPLVPLQQEASSLGSGVIVDAGKGCVITNNHVIENADEITVTLQDGRHIGAKLVGTDADYDIAVIQMEPKNLTEMPVADSEHLQVGDYVVAIGNPFGLGQSANSSALGRSGLGIQGYEDVIQTDASINPGDSGGALVNLKGELVGINTAILAPTGGNIGIGFAIPSDMAVYIKNILVKHGEVRRGLLGVNVQDLTPELAQLLGLSETRGVVIISVQPNSPAKKAGLEEGDRVIAINQQPVNDSRHLRTMVGLLQIGDAAQIEITPKNENRTIKAEIAAPLANKEEGGKIHPKLAGTLLGDTASDEPVEGARIEAIHAASCPFQAGLTGW